MEAAGQGSHGMTRYLISFPDGAMDDIPDEDMPEVARAAHAVVQDALNAGCGDITVADVTALASGLRGPIHAGDEVSSSTWPRFLDLHLAGMRCRRPVLVTGSDVAGSGDGTESDRGRAVPDRKAGTRGSLGTRNQPAVKPGAIAGRQVRGSSAASSAQLCHNMRGPAGRLGF